MKRALLFSLLSVAASATLVKAGVVSYTNNAIFDAQGVIAQTTHFTCANSFCPEPNPWTVGAVTYTTGDNIVIGLGTQYGNTVPVLAYNYWTPLTGTIGTSPTYDMFGFLLGAAGTTSHMNVSLNTNAATYSFSNLSVPNVNSGFQFFGFVANGGEHLTGFSISSVAGNGSAPAITDVELGNAVPEPSAMLLVATGALGVGVLRRRSLSR